MKLFQLDFQRLVLLILPPCLRFPRIYALLLAMTFGIEELYRSFSRQREANLTRLRRNGQVCYLRALLNDELDPEQRRIVIDDASQPGEWLMIYDEHASYQLLINREPGTAEKPVPLLYDEATILENTSFFTVYVPWSEEMNDLTNRLRSLLNEYKLLSKTYIISYTV